MTAQEIIEKIRAEIERQEKQCPLDTYEGRHKLFILGGLKTFLSDLEKEEKPINPVCEGLEEEIKSFWDYFYGKDRRVTRAINIYDFANLARHFAEWGAEHLKK